MHSGLTQELLGPLLVMEDLLLVIGSHRVVRRIVGRL